MPRAVIAKATEKPDEPADEQTPAPAKAAPKKTAARAATRASGLGTLASLEDSKEYVNGCWWGREGGGKTTDVLTAANYGKIITVNAEGGAKKKPLRDFGIDLTNIIPWPGTDKDGKSAGEITYESLEALSWELASELENEPDKYFAVCWDSGSEIYDILVGNERYKQYLRNEDNRGTSNFKPHREDPTFTDIADYGVATTQYKILLRRFRDLPCHFLITALERRDVDEDTSKVAYGPAVGPSAQTALLGLVDIVVNTRASSLQTGPDPEVDLIDEFVGTNRATVISRAKDRFRALPRNMVNPTFERIWQYIDETLTEADDEQQAAWVAARKASAEYIEGAKAARKAAAKRGG
jgi:hypothetical protein